jgi:hypothetical protein
MRGFVIEIQPDGGVFYSNTENGRSAYVGIVDDYYREAVNAVSRTATHFIAAKDEKNEVVATGEGSRRSCTNIAINFLELNS